MKYLMDINLLLAGAWKSHSLHAKTAAWLAGRKLVLCPLTELGFLRISTNAKSSINASMEDARRLLQEFCRERKAEHIPADLPALESHPKTSAEVTDIYLASLADRHGLKLATLDGSIKHPAVELVG